MPYTTYKNKISSFLSTFRQSKFRIAVLYQRQVLMYVLQ